MEDRRIPGGFEIACERSEGRHASISQEMSQPTFKQFHASATAPRGESPDPGASPGSHVQAERALASSSDQAPTISPEQLEVIAAARRRGRKVRRAVTVSAISGWTLGFFAFISLLSGLFSLVSLLLGAALAAIAFVELKGSKKLRRFDLAAPKILGFNQIALGLVLVVYGGYGIAQALFGPSPYEAQLATGGPVAEMLEPIDNLHRMGMVVFYALLICFGAIVQGCTSLYHFTRSRHLRAYLTETPEWAVDAVRLAVG